MDGQLSPGEMSGAGGGEAKPARNPVLMGCLGVVALVVLVPVACTAMAMGGGDGDDTPSDYEVRAQCERWVEDHLKAPATAKFSNESVAGGPSSWTVTGDVDAENGFGATLRTAWTCDIRLDGDTWRGSARILE